jgi:SAM-dependent methyltransferase
VSTSSLNPGEGAVEKNRSRDAAGNLEWNRDRWGQAAGWTQHDRYGYQWGGGYVHTAASVAKVFDAYLRPYVGDRYDYDILEISPGAGRSTVELIRYAHYMALVDLNQVPIDICRERLKYYPNEVDFHVNDGMSLECVSDKSFDIIASYDSLVHAHPDIVRGYVLQSAELLRPGGIIWFDHSGKGAKQAGKRSAVTASLVEDWAREAAVEVVDQHFRNDWDCISVLRKN